MSKLKFDRRAAAEVNFRTVKSGSWIKVADKAVYKMDTQSYIVLDGEGQIEELNLDEVEEAAKEAGAEVVLFAGATFTEI